jgi:RNase P subunit RPR2
VKTLIHCRNCKDNVLAEVGLEITGHTTYHIGVEVFAACPMCGRQIRLSSASIDTDWHTLED